MSNSQFQKALTELRARVSDVAPVAATDPSTVNRTLHELDVLYAELEIQNQDLVETQLQLERARENFRAIFEHAPVAILSISATGVVLQSNRAAETILGRAHDALVGKPFVVCLGDGQLDAFFRHISVCDREQAPPPITLVARLPSGELRHLELASTSLFRHEEKSLLCHLMDVTARERARAEREKLERRIQEAERLEAIGRVAASIAHDVNNILMSVVALAEFVKTDCAGRPSESDMVSLLDAAWRGARLMRGLLGLSRPAAEPPRPTDVGELLARVFAVQRYKKGGVDVSLARSGGPTWVSGHEDDLFQALLNVTTNALEATAAGGSMTIEGEVVEDSLHNPVARIRVRDTGVGMTDEQRRRAFEPLFTTKGAAGGTGLGLTLVHKTVRAHDGFIEVESTPGMGTTVTIDLPLCAEPEAASVPPTPQTSLPKTIVVVDDEKLVRTATRRQLELAGSKVLAYDGGQAVLEDVDAGLTFDAAVVDVNMPGCSGPELVARLFERRGPMPVVFVTGASGELIPETLLSYPCVRLLRKPWGRDQLVHALQAVAREPPVGNG